MISVCLIEYYHECNAEISSLCNCNKASGNPLVYTILYGVPIYSCTYIFSHPLDKSHNIP